MAVLVVGAVRSAVIEMELIVLKLLEHVVQLVVITILVDLHLFNVFMIVLIQQILLAVQSQVN
jgi:hypothetical protein